MASTPDSVWRNPIYWLAFGCGSDAISFAPGTFGTLAAMASWNLPTYILVVTLWHL
jgi:phosphatidylglycerophosphatase A